MRQAIQGGGKTPLTTTNNGELAGLVVIGDTIFSGEWNYTEFNPQAASIANAVGASGGVGTTEVSIGAGLPLLLGGIIFDSDSAGTVLLRDSASIGVNLSAMQLAEDLTPVFMTDGIKFNSGLTVCGTSVDTICTVLWKVQ